MLWRRETVLEIKSYSKHHIDAVVTEGGSGFKWRITGFYRHPETHLRKESWKFLDTLNNQYHLPWLCLGDFNEILSREEKQGGAQRSWQQMAGFKNVIDRCEFRDLGYRGSKYTWCNQQEGPDIIYMRQDRAFANEEWLWHFHNIKVHHLIDTTSYHTPLLLAETSTISQQRKRRFHFEVIWMRRANCKDVIEEVRKDGSSRGTLEGLCEGLKQCASALTSWSKSTLGRFQK